MRTVGRGSATNLAPPPCPPYSSSDMSATTAKATGMRKVNRRTKVILAVCAVAAVAVNAGAAWAYWRITGSGTGVAQAGSTIELTLKGTSDDRKPLYPGGTSNLTVTVTNENDFPIEITAVAAGGGKPTADEAHREGGCQTTGVVVSQGVQRVSWKVLRNTIGVFTLTDGIKMTNQSDSTCQGATFTIPLKATATSTSTA
jgi:hypothetical protein